jgi:hypothetical protein
MNDRMHNYQQGERTMTKRGMKVFGAAMATASIMVMTSSAHADIKCRSTVAKESAKLTQAIAKTLQKCEQAVHDGKLGGPCPDVKSADKIQKAKDNLKKNLNKKCATSTGEFAFGRCPNETGSDASNCTSILVQDKDGEADCLSCLADHNATELVHRVVYGSLLPPADKKVGKCQAAIGKSTLGFYTSASKILVKCQGLLLKGKLSSCPDGKATDALDKAEAKKVAAISKACCGPDGVCGGATCSQGSAIQVVCQGGANDGVACAADSACPGGTCVSAATENAGGPALCEASSDCGRCQGSTSPGKPCRANGQCDSDPGNCNVSLHQCIAGGNAGASCALDSECPGSTCSVGVCTGGSNNGNVCAVAGDCPSVAGGTCVGTTGLCGGSDDYNPITDIGFLTPTCPGITSGGAPIKLTGVTGATILTCVDTQADLRSQCQDAAGATFTHDGGVPPFCVDTPADCAPTGPTHTATVVLTTAADLAGVSVNLGYKGVNFPGTGEVTGSPFITSTHPLPVANDNDDSMTLSVTDLGTAITTGNLFTVTFNDCGPVPTPAANFGCVVRSASDALGNDIQDGVSCTVTVP